MDMTEWFNRILHLKTTSQFDAGQYVERYWLEVCWRGD